MGFYFKFLKALNIQITKSYTNWTLGRVGKSVSFILIIMEFVNIVICIIVLFLRRFVEESRKIEIWTKNARRES